MISFAVAVRIFAALLCKLACTDVSFITHLFCAQSTPPLPGGADFVSELDAIRLDDEATLTGRTFVVFV